MGFKPETIKKAFARSGGRCECRRTTHKHLYGRCAVRFSKSNSGTKWEAHHKLSVEAGGGDGLANCEILCVGCHDKIHS